MCGIAGIIGRADEAEAKALIAPLAHRGPDGIRVQAVGEAALAHARLSIIDLEHGWQPLHAAGSTVVGNGEIYNYLELTHEFGLRDRLTTGSDFEPLLHLYALEGEKAFLRLRGMYAFCLIGGDGRTWLELSPRTGRTHQLRVHCAHQGWPMLGDPLYGTGHDLHLLARAIRLDLTPVLQATAPPPPAMQAALSACGWVPEPA